MEKLQDTNPQQLNAEEIIPYLDKWYIVKKLGSKLEKRAKQLFEQGEIVDGYRLRGNGMVNTIDSAQEAYDRMKLGLGDLFNDEKWNDLCKVGLKDIVKFFEECTGDPDHSTHRVMAILGPAVESKEKAQSLVAVKS